MQDTKLYLFLLLNPTVGKKEHGGSEKEEILRFLLFSIFNKNFKFYMNSLTSGKCLIIIAHSMR